MGPGSKYESAEMFLYPRLLQLSFSAIKTFLTPPSVGLSVCLFGRYCVFVCLLECYRLVS